jgi:hypothetical protein
MALGRLVADLSNGAKTRLIHWSWWRVEARGEIAAGAWTAVGSYSFTYW